jgi:hypothetical protein
VEVLVQLFNTSTEESLEVQALLSQVSGLEAIETYPTDPPRPGVNHGIQPTVTFVVSITGGLVGGVVAGITRELGKDIYGSTKELLNRKLSEWREAKNDIRRRWRIEFILSDDGELTIRGLRNLRAENEKYERLRAEFEREKPDA